MSFSNLLDPSKLNSYEAQELLKDISAYSRRYELKKVLEICKDVTDSKKTKKVIAKIEKKSLLGHKPNELFFQAGLINADEKEIIKTTSAEGLHTSINKIFEFRKQKGKFLKSALFTWVAPVVSVLATFGLLNYVYYRTLDVYAFMREWQNIKLKKFKLMNVEPPIFQYQEYFVPFFIFLLLIVLGVLTYYIYYSYKDRSMIYRLSRFYALDDMPRLLGLMHLMRQSDKSPQEVFAQMQKVKTWVGLKSFFEKLENQDKHSPGKLVKVFEAYKFPKKITAELRFYENSREFWKGVEILAEDSKELVKNEAFLYKLKYFYLAIMVAVFTPIVVFLDVVLSILDLFLLGLSLKM